VHNSFLPFSTSDEDEINGKVFFESAITSISAVVLTSLITEIYPQATAWNAGSPPAGSCKFYLLELDAVQCGRILLKFHSSVLTLFSEKNTILFL